MKKRTALIGAILSLISFGQPLFIKTGVVLSSTGLVLSVPEKVNAESFHFYLKRGDEKIKKEAEENPDKNIWDNDYVDMRKLHFARLEKYGRSMFNGETYYIGSRGGIYTLSANGTRNYKY